MTEEHAEGRPADEPNATADVEALEQAQADHPALEGLLELDAATINYGDESRVELVRDTTGASRWQFRAYNPGQPDPVAQGTLTALGLALFLKGDVASTSLDDVDEDEGDDVVEADPSTEGDAGPTE